MTTAAQERSHADTDQPALTTGAVAFWSLLDGARRAGLDTDALLAVVGLTPSDVTDPEARFDESLLLRLWEEAARRSGDPDFGLHAGEHLRFGSQHILDYLVSTAANMDQALQKFARYYRLISDSASIDVVVEREFVRVCNRPPVTAGEGARHLWEAALSIWIGYIRALVEGEVPLREVRFAHMAPARTSDHLRVLGVEPRFNSAANELVFDRSFLAQALKTSDASLAAILDEHAREMLRRLPSGDTFVDQVRWAIARSLRGAEPTLALVAWRLAISKRTLQRRLGSRGTSLAALSQEVRRELATRYLHDATLSVAEVSFLLGFASVTSFHRAFRTWTGQTPAAYRNRPEQ